VYLAHSMLHLFLSAVPGGCSSSSNASSTRATRRSAPSNMGATMVYGFGALPVGRAHPPRATRWCSSVWGRSRPRWRHRHPAAPGAGGSGRGSSPSAPPPPSTHGGLHAHRDRRRQRSACSSVLGRPGQRGPGPCRRPSALLGWPSSRGAAVAVAGALGLRSERSALAGSRPRHQDPPGGALAMGDDAQRSHCRPSSSSRHEHRHGLRLHRLCHLPCRPSRASARDFCRPPTCVGGLRLVVVDCIGFCGQMVGRPRRRPAHLDGATRRSLANAPSLVGCSPRATGCHRRAGRLRFGQFSSSRVKKSAIAKFTARRSLTCATRSAAWSAFGSGRWRARPAAAFRRRRGRDLKWVS